MTAELISATDLAELEACVRAALDRHDDSALRVLGFGEITLVVGWPTAAPQVAAKRVPLFPDLTTAQRYGALVLEYVETLRAQGVDVIPTQWVTIGSPQGPVVGYVVQPALPAEQVATNHLAHHPQDSGVVIRAIVATIESVTSPRLGLDAQLSNWAWDDGRLRYFDVTTPILSDETGQARLDLALVSSALPAVARPALRRFVAPGIIAVYHRPREVVLDLLGNLWKERRDELVDTAIAVANETARPPFTRAEVDDFYRSNARLWEMLMWLRRMDRWWTRRVRRRTYPFLLPSHISR